MFYLPTITTITVPLAEIKKGENHEKYTQICISKTHTLLRLSCIDQFLSIAELFLTPE